MRNHEQAGPGAGSFCFYEDFGAVDLIAFAEAWASLSAEVAEAITAHIDDSRDGLLQQRDQRPLDLDEATQLEAIERVGGWSRGKRSRPEAANAYEKRMRSIL